MEKNSNCSKDLSVVIPIFNEEKNIDLLYARLKKVLLEIGETHEIIFINDGSSDHSIDKITTLAENDEYVFFIDFSRNFGHQIAVTAGLDLCSGKATIIMDGDLQDPPEVILDFIEKYKEGYEVINAQRIARKGDSVFKKTTAHLFYRVLQKITSFDIPIDVGDFRLIDHKVVKSLRNMPEQGKFLRGQIAWLGFKQTIVSFERDERKYGNTGYTMPKMIKFALNGITGFSDIPLRLVSVMGFVISALSLLIIFYAIYSHFILDRTITGWTSLIISSMFIGGVQLLSIGIIGEYISRINKNTQKRPLYVIRHSNLN